MKLKAKMKREKSVIKYEMAHFDKILVVIVGLTGMIAFWRGVWSYLDAFPVLSDPVASIAFGIIVLFFTGWIIKRN